AELRVIGDRVMEAVQKVADSISGRRRPLGRPDRVIGRLLQVGGEDRASRSVAETKELGLNVHLLRLPYGLHALGAMAGLEQQVRAAAGRGPEHPAQVVDARRVAAAVDDVQASGLRITRGGGRDLGREAVARVEN